MKITVSMKFQMPLPMKPWATDIPSPCDAGD